MLFFQNVILFLHDLMQLLNGIESIYYLFYWWDLLLLFYFSSNQESLWMIHHDSNLFYNVYNSINEHNWRQTHYLSLISNYFDIYFWAIEKSSSITSSASLLIMISVVSLFESITRSSSLCRDKVICYC